MTVVLPAVHELPPARSFVVVKLSLRGETYRIPFTHDELTWRALETKVDECYDDVHRPAVWTLVYRDDEGDLVTVSNEREFREASFVFSELVEQPNEEEHALHMHFYVVAKLSLKEQLAPVMQTVTEISEKMARIAVETRDSLRKSSYVERGRESLHQSAVHTRQALSSARRGLSQRMRRASADISDIPRRLRTRSRVSSGDVRDDTASPQTLMATNVEHDDGDEVHAERHVAELLERSRVESTDTEDNTVNEQPNESARANTPTQSVVPVLNAVADDDVEDIGHASDAETASTASEGTHDEWDVVQSSSPERPPSPFFEVEVDDEMEASFTRWESELATIRDIMPQIDLDLCVDLLTKHNGKLEATLVELTEL